MALPDKLLKEKVKEVRQLVPNFSNNSDIVLILEHYNYNVDQTVSAILENGGTEALQSWTQTSKGSTNKQKKKYSKKGFVSEKQPSLTTLKDSNTVHDNGTSKIIHSDKNTSSPYLPQNPRNPHAGIEKSYKELQRQITSLTHLKIVFNEKVEKSYKRINEVFKELQQQLAERHSELTKQLDGSKMLALEALNTYEEKSKCLRIKVDKAQSMSADEVADLRNEIKDFVTQRRHIEETAHSCKFNCDFSSLVSSIQQFGEVQQARGIANHMEAGSIPCSDQPNEQSDSNGVSLKVLNQSESLIKYEAGTLDIESTNKIVFKDQVVDQKPFKRTESTRNANRGRRPNRQNNRNGFSQETRKPLDPGKSSMPAPLQIK